MPPKSFERLIKSEESAKKFLTNLCWKNYRRRCIRCGSYELYKLKDKTFRCKRCYYDFHDFTGRWLNLLHIPYRDWLRVVRYFEQELSPHKIAQQVGLSYPTVHKAVTVLRRAIVAQQGELLVREGEAPEAYGGRKPQARGREAAGKVEVFGILERDGLVQVEGLRNLRAEMVLNLAVKKVRCGSIVYTDRYDIYDSLMFYGYRQDQKKIIASGKVYIDRIEGFWSFAKERLIKHHGVSKDKFPLYLKEMEFRYNHRKEPLFPLLCQYLARLIPGRY